MTPRGSHQTTEAMTRSDSLARLQQAHSFLDAAKIVDDFADDVGDGQSAANVISSMAVLAGIAASDAICGMALQLRSASGNHRDAIELLRRTRDGQSSARLLGLLLDVKSKSAYEPRIIGGAKAQQALHRAEQLVATADQMTR